MKKKFPIITLVVCLAILLLIQYKGVMPLAYKAAQSDLFMYDSGDEGSVEATSTVMTMQAFNQCNQYIKDELGDQTTISFTPEPINSWALGNFEYLINAEVTISDNNATPQTQKYACRIQYSQGKDTSAVSNKENWSVVGISGIDKL